MDHRYLIRAGAVVMQIVERMPVGGLELQSVEGLDEARTRAVAAAGKKGGDEYGRGSRNDPDIALAWIVSAWKRICESEGHTVFQQDFFPWLDRGSKRQQMRLIDKPRQHIRKLVGSAQEEDVLGADRRALN